jgi:hypothetical protein
VEIRRYRGTGGIFRKKSNFSKKIVDIFSYGCFDVHLNLLEKNPHKRQK